MGTVWDTPSPESITQGAHLTHVSCENPIVTPRFRSISITLAEEIIDNIDRKKDWKRGVTYWTEDGHHDEGDANITDEDLVINCERKKNTSQIVAGPQDQASKPTTAMPFPLKRSTM